MDLIDSLTSPSNKLRNRPFLFWQKTVFILMSLGGIAALLNFYQLTTSDNQSFMAGFSKSRVFFGSPFILLVFGFLLATSFLFWKPRRIPIISEKIDLFIRNSPSRLLAFISITFFSIGIIGSTSIILHFATESRVPYLLLLSANYGLGLIVWVLSCLIVLILALILNYHSIILGALRKRDVAIPQTVLVLMLIFTSIQWITLSVHGKWLQAINGWFWPYTPKQFSPTQLSILIAFAIAVGIGVFITRTPRQLALHTVLLFVAAIALQIGFGFATGTKFDAMRDKYASAPFSDELRLACEAEQNTLSSIRNYDELHGNSFWYGTKPPGFFAVYAIARDTLHFFQPSVKSSSNACVRHLLSDLAIVLPLFAAFSVIPLFGKEVLLSKRSYPGAASLLYVSAPAMVLMLMALDQSILPFLFTLTMLTVLLAVHKRSWWLGSVSGGFIMLSIFVSFSLLPIFGFIFAYTTLNAFFGGERKEKIRVILPVIGMVLGGVIVSVILFKVFDYSPISRYVQAFESHRTIKDFELSFGNLVKYSTLNNIEIAFWSGAPLFILTLIGIIKSTHQTFKRKPIRQDIFNVSFGAMYIGLMIFGQTRGEVGRIWIFLLPSAALIAADQAYRLFRKPRDGMILVLSLQLISSLIVYLNMDWWW
jgi:hypothetical protein